MLKQLQQKLTNGSTVTFKVKIVPKSAHNRIVGELGPGVLKIKIAAVAANGKANQKLIEFLSEVFKKPKKNITIASGITSPLKIISIEP